MAAEGISPHGARFAPDLSWIEGDLVHEEFEGGFWALDFGSGDAPLGGRVVLGNPPELAGFDGGERVRVEGAPSTNEFSTFMAGPLYDLRTVERVGAG